MGGSVKEGNHLHVVLQPVIGERLVFGGGERVGFDDSGHALVLEVAFELKGEAVQLVEGGLPDGLAQDLGTVEVVGVIPINLAQPQVRPVHDTAFGQVDGAVARPGELEQGLDAVEEPGGGVGGDGDGFRGQVDLVGLRGDGLLVGVERVAYGNRAGDEREGDGSLPAAGEFDAEARGETFVQADSGDIAGGNVRQFEAPAGAETEIAGGERDALRFGQHGIAAGGQRRNGRRCGGEGQQRKKECQT